jgi:hypothetical protein
MNVAKWWWVPVVANTVIIGLIIFVAAVAQSRVNAPLRAKSSRLDAYCTLTRFAIGRARDRVSSENLVSRNAGLEEWRDLVANGGRGLTACMPEIAAVLASECLDADAVCVKMSSGYALANLYPTEAP